MAVHAHARHLPHGLPALGTGTTLLLDEHPGCVPTAPAGIADTTLLSDLPRSDLTCSHGFLPRKRALLAAASDFLPEDQRKALTPAAMQGPVAVPPVVDKQSRAVGSGAASTSGKTAANGASATVSQGLLSWPYHRDLEIDIDAAITLEMETMRSMLEEARLRHARALLAAAGRAASGRLRAVEAELERALRRNAELEEKARQMAAECQAWMGVARSHEAVAAGLRATLDQLLQSSCPAATAPGVGGEVEDAQSCCFDAPAAADDAAASSRSKTAAPSCRSCGGGEACVLLLPCRHLCLCRACEAAAYACPICSAAKNGALHVLVS